MFARLPRTTCKNCGLPVRDKGNFCSEICEVIFQRRPIQLVCDGCGVKFQKEAKSVRKTNYCSLVCYHNTTRTSEDRRCKVCGNYFEATGTQIRNGFGIFCSRKCQNSIHKKQRISFKCQQCGAMFKKSPAIAKTLPKYCSKTCRDNHMRDYVTRICVTCGKSFQLPTWETDRGKGKFCSRRCYVGFRGESVLEMIMRQAIERFGLDYQQEVKFGKFHADFVLEKFKIVIECDSYWHTLPGMIDRDKRKDKLLNKLGYRVFRFKEGQIRHSVKKCLEMISALNLSHNP